MLLLYVSSSHSLSANRRINVAASQYSLHSTAPTKLTLIKMPTSMPFANSVSGPPVASVFHRLLEALPNTYGKVKT